MITLNFNGEITEATKSDLINELKGYEYLQEFSLPLTVIKIEVQIKFWISMILRLIKLKNGTVSSLRVNSILTA